MLRDSHGFSGFSTNDIATAKRFYGETLGLDVSEENGMLTLPPRRWRLGHHLPQGEPRTGQLHGPEPPGHRYRQRGRRPDRGRGHLRALRRAGQDDRGIARAYPPPIAWFKDPAGNILSVIQA